MTWGTDSGYCAGRWRSGSHPRQSSAGSHSWQSPSALLGLPLALAAVHAINSLQDSRLPLTSQVVIDGPVLAFVVTVTVATGLLFGVLPAVRATRGHAQAALNETSRGSSSGSERAWTRSVLVVCEVTLACVLLVGAGLLLRSFVWLMETERGFSTKRVATVRLDLGPQYGDPARLNAFVSEIRRQVSASPGTQMYFPLAQNPIRSLDLVVRTAVAESASRQGLAAAVRSVDPSQPIGRLRTMDDLVSTAVSPRRFLVWLIAAFAVMALVLASLGIYGVVAHGVAQRRREIGIRVALGATAGEVQRAVIGQALVLTVAGLALGLIATFALRRTISSLLYALPVTDAATHVAVTALLLVVALLAGVVPARRAARVDPASALRDD